MPPVMGLVAFIMSQVTAIPYTTIALSAFLPAILYYTAVYAQLHLEALKLGMKGIPKEERPRFFPVIKKGWYLLIPLLILIYSLFIEQIFCRTEFFLFHAVFNYHYNNSITYSKRKGYSGRNF